MAKIKFNALIEKFHKKGEKTGWTYIEVPTDLIQKLMPNQRKSFRVKGKLDLYAFEGVALLPMGGGTFIMPLNSNIRKGIKKEIGDTVKLQMEPDTREVPLSVELVECLQDEPAAQDFFNSLPKGHQRYFSNWIKEAKTQGTKTKRLAMAINALALGLGFSEMIRQHRNTKP